MEKIHEEVTYWSYSRLDENLELVIGLEWYGLSNAQVHDTNLTPDDCCWLDRITAQSTSFASVMVQKPIPHPID